MRFVEAARQTLAEVHFDGVDITSSIRPYLLSVTYTDQEEDESDDIQLKLQDRNGLWMQHWLQEAEEAASAAKLSMEVILLQDDWPGGRVLDCGEFELDNVKASGPPATVTIKGSALPYSSPIRQTKRSKAWEGYNLSGIAREMANNAGMTCMFESDNDPYYERVEQTETTDIAFLSELCHQAGISLKITNRFIVLYDQAAYERKPPKHTLLHGGGGYISYNLDSSSAETQYSSCRVSYVDPGTGQCIEGFAKIENYNADAKNNQQLEISAKVATVEEAEQRAEKELRRANKYAKTASFTVPGNPYLLAGVTMALKGWGGWDGTYIIKTARHTVSSSGYTTQVTLRKCLEGY